MVEERIKQLESKDGNFIMYMDGSIDMKNVKIEGR